MSGSVKSVMFITLEDETANTNLTVWSSVFDANTIGGGPALHVYEPMNEKDDDLEDIRLRQMQRSLAAPRSRWICGSSANLFTNKQLCPASVKHH